MRRSDVLPHRKKPADEWAVAMETLEARRLMSFSLVHSTSTIPVAESGMFAAAVGDEVIFGGGTVGKNGRHLSLLEVYDTDNGRWYTDTTPVPVGGEVAITGTHLLFSSPSAFDFNTATGNCTAVTGLNTNVTNSVPLAIGPKVIFAGGVQPIPNLPDSEASAYVDVYDTNTGTADTTYQLSDASIPYTDTIDGQALFVGAVPFLFSEGTPDYHPAIDIYNSSSGQWSHVAMTAAYASFATANVDDLAIFAGGDALNVQAATYLFPTSTVNIYHADTGQVTSAALSQARDSIASTTVGNIALFAGGVYFRYVDSTYRYYPQTVVDLYNAQTGTWSTAQLSVPRNGAIATTVGDNAYIASGATTANQQRVVDIYHSETNTWSTTTMPVELTGLRATTLGQFIVYYGTSSPTIESYDTVHGTWQILATTAARTKMAVAAVDNEAIFAGGISGAQVSSAVDIFTRTYGAPSAVKPALQPVALVIDASPASWLESDQAGLLTTGD